MSDLGSRIRQVLSEKGMSQSQLARMVGVKQQTISYICALDGAASSSRYSSAIASALGVNPVWLQSGQGGKFNPTVRIELEGVELAVRRVPLLRIESVPAFMAAGPETKEMAQAGLMTDAPAGKHSFAVEIEGDSMQPLFKSGDRVVIDPEVRAEPGDFVLAQIPDGVTFRKYRARAGAGFELAPLNDDWPIIPSDDLVQVVGVMIEHRSYRSRR